MQKYGKIENGELLVNNSHLVDYKPIVHQELPEFDQMTQYVYQGEIVENEDHISIGVLVKDIENIDEGEDLEN